MKILLTKADCSQCEYIKTHADLSDVEVIEIKTDDVDSMATLAYHSAVTEAEKGLPILIVREDEHITDFAEICRYFKINVPAECSGDTCSL